MAGQRMKQPMRSITGLARTPFRDLRSAAQSAMACPASGRAESDLAGRDRLSSMVPLTDWGPGYNSQVNENIARPQAGYPGIGGQYLRIRTLLVGGPDWLARRRRCSAGVSGAGSATHRGSGMYLDDFGHQGPDAPTGGGVHVNARREASRSALCGWTIPRRRRSGNPAADLLRNGCARLAERIRTSAGVTAAATPEQRAVTGTPWLGLLLWFFACAALFVSLMMRPDVDHEHRVVTRNPAPPTIAGHPYTVPALTRPSQRSPIDCPLPACHRVGQQIGRALGSPRRVQSAAVAAVLPQAAGPKLADRPAIFRSEPSGHGCSVITPVRGRVYCDRGQAHCARRMIWNRLCRRFFAPRELRPCD